MAPSVSTGDGGRNVAGEYLVAEPLDYFHFAEARLTGSTGWCYSPIRNKTCCLGEGNRRGTSIETEGLRLRTGSGEGALQAMSPAKPATDPDSGIFTASMA